MTTHQPPHDGRFVVSLFVANLAGWVSGLLHQGSLLGHASPPRVVLAVSALGAFSAGLLRGASSYARALYVLPFALYCGTLTFSTASYVDARGRIINAELLLPSAAAAVPFAAAYCAVGRHVEGLERRRRRDG